MDQEGGAIYFPSAPTPPSGSAWSRSSHPVPLALSAHFKGSSLRVDSRRAWHGIARAGAPEQRGLEGEMLGGIQPTTVSSTLAIPWP